MTCTPATVCLMSIAAMMDWGGSSATLNPDATAFARVDCVNRMTSGTSPHLAFTLDMDGLTVGVTVEQGLGNAPDVYAVTVPDGFVAIPPSLTLDEDSAGVILIYETGAIPLG